MVLNSSECRLVEEVRNLVKYHLVWDDIIQRIKLLSEHSLGVRANLLLVLAICWPTCILRCSNSAAIVAMRNLLCNSFT